MPPALGQELKLAQIATKTEAERESCSHQCTLDSACWPMLRWRCGWFHSSLASPSREKFPGLNREFTPQPLIRDVLKLRDTHTQGRTLDWGEDAKRRKFRCESITNSSGIDTGPGMSCLGGESEEDRGSDHKTSETGQ